MASPAAEAVARLAGGAPAALEPIAGGGNGRVYRLETADGRTLALKAYFRHPGDPRDRLATEFGALSFLWAQGLRSIPEPLARDPEAGLGLYGFVPGDRPLPPTAGDIDAAVAFLGRLKDLRTAPGAADLGEASEARFSLAAVAANVQARLDRLAEAGRGEGLPAFLERDLLPAWRAIAARAQTGSGPDWDRDLEPGRRTLSPSDFGFHNALRAPAGLVFLDFEYFGWDDPAKTLADFLLHPGMGLDPALGRRFAAALLARLDLPGLPERARLALPLFGVKWCAILLNEFLPGSLDRRAFADPGTDAAVRQARQLEKARRMLHSLLDDHAHAHPLP